MSFPQILPDGVILREGAKPGSSVVLMAGVHGNEVGGIEALRHLEDELSPQAGRVFLVYANPEAISAGKRMLEKNLNRVFFAGNEGTSYEDQRARELMPILDAADVLLDLHTFNDPSGEPFIICEDEGIELANRLEPKLISTNWTEIEPGSTDGYMHTLGKIGICIEAGPTSDLIRSRSAALDAARIVLSAYGVIEAEIPTHASEPKLIIRAKRAVIRTENDFSMDSSLKSFQKLIPGQVIGRQGDEEFIADTDECIIFPRADAPIGAEVFIVGKLV